MLIMISQDPRRIPPGSLEGFDRRGKFELVACSSSRGKQVPVVEAEIAVSRAARYRRVPGDQAAVVSDMAGVMRAISTVIEPVEPTKRRSRSRSAEGEADFA